MSPRRTRSQTSASTSSRPTLAPQPAGVQTKKRQSANARTPSPKQPSPRQARQVTAPTPIYQDYELKIRTQKFPRLPTPLRKPYPCYSTHIDRRRPHPQPLADLNAATIGIANEKAARLQAENWRLGQWWIEGRDRDRVMNDLQTRVDVVEARNVRVVKENEKLMKMVTEVKEGKEALEMSMQREMREVRWAYEAEVQLLREEREGLRGGRVMSWGGWFDLGFGFGRGVV